MTTSTDRDRAPVVIAAGQAIERDELVGPIDLMERAARGALTEATGVESHIDTVTVIGVLSRAGNAPASRLAQRLRLSPRRVETTAVGGNAPIWVLGEAAQAVAEGQADAVLVAGAEAMRSRRAQKSQSRRRASDDEEPALADDPVVGDDRVGVAAAELAVGLATPAQVYPMFESVLAHRAGRDPDAQRRWLGELMAPFTEVAAKHPFAWFPEPATAAELAEVVPDNRLTVEPYTKRMNAFMGVDQGAAFVVCSLGLARELGLAGQAVHVWSVASVNDAWFVPERPDLGSSPGIAAAGRGALVAAGLGIDDVGLIDLYSCFPCAVQMGAAALGLRTDDRRGLTLTGGLPYFGGPGNNYSSHSLATAAGRLRERGGLALVTGLGWYATKHSVAVIGAEPPDDGFTLVDTAEAQAEIDATALPVALGAELGAEAHSMAIEAASVQYGRDGAPEAAVVVGSLTDGRRVVARAADTTSVGGQDLVGLQATVAGDPPTFTLS